MSSRHCRKNQRLLPGYLDGELSEEMSFEFEQHLLQCPACRITWRQFQGVEEQLFHLRTPILTDGDRDRIWASVENRIASAPVIRPPQEGLDSMSARRPGRRAATRRFRRLFTVAAGAAAVAGGVWFIFPESPPEPLVPSGVDVSSQAERPELPAPTRTSPPTASDPGLPANPDKPAPRIENRPRESQPLEVQPLQVQPMVEWQPPEVATTGSGGAPDAVRQEVRQILARMPDPEALNPAATRHSGNWMELLGLEPAAELAPRGETKLHALQSCLADDSDEVARNAANAIREVLRNRPPAVFGPTLVRDLLRNLRRPERGLEALEALVWVDLPNAHRAICDAVELPHLRRPALLHLMTLRDADLLAAKERQLLRLLRSSEPGDSGLFQECVASLHCREERSLGLLWVLYREGAPRDLLRDALARSGPRVLGALENALNKGNGTLVTRRQALRLVVACPLSRFALSLQSLVLGRQDVADSVDAIAHLEPVLALSTFSAITAEQTLSANQQRLVDSGFHRALIRAEAPGRALRRTLEQLDPQHDEHFFGLLHRIDGSRRIAGLLDLLGDPDLSPVRRSTASLYLAQQGESPPADSLLAVLQREREGFDDRQTWEGDVVSSVLVALYQTDGEAGLRAGCQALGLEVPRGQTQTLARYARSAAQQTLHGDPSRSLERIRSLLAIL